MRIILSEIVRGSSAAMAWADHGLKAMANPEWGTPLQVGHFGHGGVLGIGGVAL